VESHCCSPVRLFSGSRCCGSGMSVETEVNGKSVGYSQTVVSDCGVTSFFVKVDVLVLHPGRSFERCGPGVLLACSYK